MKISTSIWIRNKEKSSFLFSKPCNLIARLFGFLAIFSLPSCMTWPDSSERVLSVSEERQSLPDYINRGYLLSLLAIAETRQGQLVSFGSEVCLPGQMVAIKRMHDLIEREIDGNLLFDAHKNMINIFYGLHDLRYKIESEGLGYKCFEEIYKGNSEVILGDGLVDSGVPEWEELKKLEIKIRGQQ